MRLEPTPPDGGTPDGGFCPDCANGCCMNGTCTASTFNTCGRGGVACVTCDRKTADACDSQGTCACGTGPACNPATTDQCTGANAGVAAARRAASASSAWRASARARPARVAGAASATSACLATPPTRAGRMARCARSAASRAAPRAPAPERRLAAAREHLDHQALHVALVEGLVQHAVLAGGEELPRARREASSRHEDEAVGQRGVAGGGLLIDVHAGAPGMRRSQKMMS